MPESRSSTPTGPTRVAMAQGQQARRPSPTELIARALALDPSNRRRWRSRRRRRWSATTATARSRTGAQLRAVLPPDSDDARADRRDRAVAQRSRRATARAPAKQRHTGDARSARRRRRDGGRRTRRARSAARVEASRPTTRSSCLRARSTGRACRSRSCACTASELPRAFTLDDSMAMSPARELSSAAKRRRRGARLQVGQRDAASRRPARHQRAGQAGRAATCAIVDRRTCMP